jgi:hypothetical protein
MNEQKNHQKIAWLDDDPVLKSPQELAPRNMNQSGAPARTSDAKQRAALDALELPLLLGPETAPDPIPAPGYVDMSPEKAFLASLIPTGNSRCQTSVGSAKRLAPWKYTRFIDYLQMRPQLLIYISRRRAIRYNV